jgi:hypothetical protein
MQKSRESISLPVDHDGHRAHDANEPQSAIAASRNSEK